MSLSPDANGESTIRLFRAAHGVKASWFSTRLRLRFASVFFLLTRASFKANEGFHQYVDRYRLHSHNGHQHRFYDFPCHRAYGYSREVP